MPSPFPILLLRHSLNVLANDKGLSGSSTGLTVTAVTQSTHGSVAFTSSGVTYSPVSGYVGTDTFTYTITDTRQQNGNSKRDGNRCSSTPPTANNDTYTVLNNVVATPLSVLKQTIRGLLVRPRD